MRQAVKARKKFQSRIPFILDPGMKIPKKIGKKFKKLKTTFRHYFQPKRDEIGRESEKKILVPNSVRTRPRQENSKKKSKKIRKIKKVNSGIISIQNGLREAEQERKEIQSRIPFILDPSQKIQKKKSKKIQKIKKVNSGIISIKNGLREAEKKIKKKIQSPIPFILNPGKKIPKKVAEKFKKLKKLIPALFLSKTG